MASFYTPVGGVWQARGSLSCYDRETVLELPYSELRSVHLLFGSTSFDVMWIPTDVVTVEGKALRVRVPSNYLGTGRSSTPTVRTGQETMWAHAHGYAEASGQRDFKATMEGGGASMIGILGVERIDFENPARRPAEPEKPKSLWQRLFG